jgi:FKBP-type peptidyl-prolyl cis-trans isomerase FklB
MKRTVLAIMTLVTVMSAVVATAQDATTPLTSEKDKLSYSMGMDLAGQLKANGVDIDPAIFAKGMRDLFAGKTLLTDTEAKAIITALQTKMFLKRTSELQAATAKNRTEGEAFLAANKKKPGVVALPSGVQYKVITKGTGPKPTAEQTVVFNYRGVLIDGKEFDSSFRRGQPATLPVKGLIKGWTEVLQLMPVGSKWHVFIPPALAFGEKGSGVDVGPNATVIFEIELVAIK